MQKVVLTSLLLGLVVSVLAQCGNKQATAFYETGWQLYRERKADDALQALHRCIYHDAACAEAYLLRAMVWELAGRPENALTDVMTARALNPLMREAALRAALVLYQLERWQEAYSAFREVLTLPAGETHLLFYAQLPHHPATVGVFTAQSDLRPIVYSYLGQASTHLGWCAEAVNWLDSAMLLQGRQPELLVRRALACLKCQREDEAKASLFEALKVDPHHAAALYQLALLETDAADAENHLSQAIATDSLLPEAWLARAHLRMKQQNFAGAEYDYTQALTILRHDPELWLNRGMAREKQSDYAGAYQDYTTAIGLQEDLLKAWLHRGNVLMQLKDYARAVEDYTAALTYDPNYAKAWLNRGMAHYYLKKHEAACADFLKAGDLGLAVPARFLQACKKP
jgi:tetratricopeptide (TPR) repeat protein